MLRRGLAVIAGYLAMSAFDLLAVFLVLRGYGISSADDPKLTARVWCVCLAAGFVGALLGGLVATVVGGSRFPAWVLAGLILVLSLPMLTFKGDEKLASTNEEVKSTMGALIRSMPGGFLIGTPIVFAVGAAAGGGLAGRRKRDLGREPGSAPDRISK